MHLVSTSDFKNKFYYKHKVKTSILEMKALIMTQLLKNFHREPMIFLILWEMDQMIDPKFPVSLTSHEYLFLRRLAAKPFYGYDDALLEEKGNYLRSHLLKYSHC